MAPRSIRFPDELERRLKGAARAEDRSVSYIVLKACERWLDGKAYPPAPIEERNAPAKASIEDRNASARRILAMAKADEPTRPSSGPPPSVAAYRPRRPSEPKRTEPQALQCPKATCRYEGPEERCPWHKLKLVPG